MKICIECEQEVTVKELLELLSNLKPETKISFIPERNKLFKDGLPNIGGGFSFPLSPDDFSPPLSPDDFSPSLQHLKITF